jgi:hypothetical protein
MEACSLPSCPQEYPIAIDSDGDFFYPKRLSYWISSYFVEVTHLLNNKILDSENPYLLAVSSENIDSVSI